MNGLDHDTGGATPLGIFLLVCLIALTWLLPRRTALVPLLLTTCYMPLSQAFIIGGANIQFFRVLLLVSWCRVFIRGEIRDLVFTRMDKVFVWWLVVTLVIGSFTQPSEFGSRFASRIGEIYNAGAMYFLVRCWLRSVKELVGLLSLLAWLIVPLTAALIFERYTDRNLFFVFGGVSEFTDMRDGVVRAQGAFRQPILAGTYGATLFPLFIGLYFQGKETRKRALLGIACATIISVMAASSGAVLAVLGAATALGLWWFRYSMRAVRWAIILALVALALTMQAPVWYIFARLSDIAGGTGWYRSYLIEQAVNHFDQWWFTGSLYTANWAPGGQMPAGNPNNTDILNQFVLEGLQGGLLKVILFITLIVIGFKNIGRFTRVQADLPFSYRFMVWSLGACLLAHCLCFFSVTYFDQIIIMWYLLLAALAMLQTEFLLIPRTGNIAAQSV